MEKYVYQVCHAYRFGTLGTDSTRTFGFVFTFAEAGYPKNLWQSVRRLWRFCWCIFSPRKAIFSVAPPVRACSGGSSSPDAGRRSSVPVWCFALCLYHSIVVQVCLVTILHNESMEFSCNFNTCVTRITPYNCSIMQ